MSNLIPGDIIQNRYRVVRQIGQGGFGAVYEAIDQRLNSRVALKQLLLLGDEVTRAFRREAELLANLHHPALPVVIDYFTDQSGQFLVMQYIAGDDLAALLAQRGAPFPVDEVLHWADQLLGALNYLHTRTPPILHRDIKPQNLKLIPPDEVVLLDFGLAKGSAAVTAGLTTGRSIMAYTPGFAPLEQIHGLGTTAQTDLYALAATLYHLLTQELPPDATIRANEALRRRPDPLRPVHELNAAVPAAVGAVLMEGLALNAEDRPASAAAMRAALESAARPRLPTSNGRGRRMMWAAVAGVVVASVLLVAITLRSLAANDRGGIVAETGTEGTAGPAMTAQPTPTFGETTAVATAEHAAIPTSTIDASSVIATASPATNATLTGRLAFESYQDDSLEIFVMEADGSNPTRLTNNPANDYDPSWSPDGQRIAFQSDLGGNTEIFVMEADGSNLIRLTNNPANDYAPSWSPDGQRIVFESGRDGNPQIYVMDANGSAPIRLTNGAASDFDPSWSPDGQRIAFESDRNGNPQIYVMQADGSGQTRLTDNAASSYDPAWSPDSQQIAFTSERDGNAEIYVMRADGANPTRLTNNPANDINPTWSPDGQRIAFESDRDGNREVYVMQGDGGNAIRLTNNDVDDYNPAWSFGD